MKEVVILPVHQWAESWDKAKWAPDEGLGRPSSRFYLASMSLKELRALANVSRREISERKKGTKNPGYQRPRDEKRSERIGRYIDYGYPLSNQKGLVPNEHRDLIHPGWLPSAILINVIPVGQTRRRHGKDLPVTQEYEVSIKESDGAFRLYYPEPEKILNDSRVGKDIIEPIEIIDGQHRLYAADDSESLSQNYEVPVVIFEGLSEQWQAYLFWVINVEPKKINTSLAFDLYPELRSSSWLERGETVKVYQEHRAQELTEILWRHHESPWFQRIELHGRRVDGHISNAAFIRTLTSSFIRRWKKEGRIGGLFGSVDKDGNERVIRWSRLQQAAFLIYIWRKISEVIEKGDSEWIKGCVADFSKASQEKRDRLAVEKLHPAFAGPDTLVAADQGVRAIMVVFNALLSASYADIDLENWEIVKVSEDDSEGYVSDALDDVRRQEKISNFLSEVCECLFNSSFDWRMGSAESINDPDQRQLQMAYKGSSGYSLLQNNIIKHLHDNGSERIKEYIAVVKERLGR